MPRQKKPDKPKMLGRSRKNPEALRTVVGPEAERALIIPDGRLAIRWRSRVSGGDGSADSDGDRPKRPAGASAPTAWKRPTGRAISAYSDWLKWELEKWMWEFLRRDEHYQSFHEAPPGELQAAAAEHFLRDYKPFTEEYEENPPRFLVSIRSFPHREEFAELHRGHANGEDPADNRTIPGRLDIDDVVIRFKIAPMLFNMEGSLERQLSDARARLHSFAELMRGVYLNDTKQPEPEKLHDYRPIELLELIRFLDVKAASALSITETYEVLFPPGDVPFRFQRQDEFDPGPDPAKTGSRLYREAKRICDGGYAGITLVPPPPSRAAGNSKRDGAAGQEKKSAP